MSKMYEDMMAKLSLEDRNVVAWMYEATKTPEVATMLWGYAEAVAVDHPTWTFFEVLREMHSHITVLKLDEHLLHLRRPQ